MVASNYVPRRLGLCWSCVPGLLPVSSASPSMDHEHGTVCQPILEHQIRPSAPSSVISRPTCFSSSLRCCWQVGSAPFVRRRCDCLASSAPFTNIQTYLLTYLLYVQRNCCRHQWLILVPVELNSGSLVARHKSITLTTGYILHCAI